MKKKPDVIFVGLQKAGTSFLRGYFTHHPGVAWSREAIYFMTEPFDPHKTAYPEFQDTSTGQCFIDMYESLALGYLEETEKPWGEIDLLPDFDLDNYEMPPIDLIPNRIKQVLPDSKIIITLRNQVDWLRSNYLHFVPNLDVKKNTFGDFLLTLEGKRLLQAGHYDRIISTYFDVFGKEKVLVMLLEQLHLELEISLQRMCTFLGVDFIPYPREKWKKNQGRPKMEARSIRFLSRMGLSPKIFSRSPQFVKDVGRRIQNIAGDSDVISTREKQMLQAFYAFSNKQTSRLLGVNLANHGYNI